MQYVICLPPSSVTLIESISHNGIPITWWKSIRSRQQCQKHGNVFNIFSCEKALDLGQRRSDARMAACAFWPPLAAIYAFGGGVKTTEKARNVVYHVGIPAAVHVRNHSFMCCCGGWSLYASFMLQFGGKTQRIENCFNVKDKQVINHFIFEARCRSELDICVILCVVHLIVFSTHGTIRGYQYFDKINMKQRSIRLKPVSKSLTLSLVL